MEDCKYRDKLSAYLDSELPHDEKREIELHLKECEACRDELAGLKAISQFTEKHKDLNDNEYWEKAAIKIEIEAALPEKPAKIIDLKAKRTRFSLGMGWRITAVAASVALLTYIGLHDDEIIPDRLGMQPDSVQTDTLKPEPTTAENSSKQTIREDQDAGDIEGEKVADKMSKTPELKELSSREEINQSIDIIGIERKEKQNKKSVDNLSPSAPNRSVNIPTQKSEITEQTKQEVGRSRISGSATGEKQQSLESESTAKKSDLNEQLEVLTDDDNYKDKNKGIIYAVPQISAPPAVHSVQPTDESRTYDMTNVDKLIKQELEFWRSERDSFLSAAKKSDNKKKGIQDYLNRTQSNSLLQDNSKEKNIHLDRESLEKLLKAWFEICRLTPDSSERNDGKLYLQSIAESGQNKTDSLAKFYLKELGE